MKVDDDIYSHKSLTTEQHGSDLADAAATNLQQRYNTGQREHGGQLWRKHLLPNALEEVTDQMVYIMTLMQQWDALEKRLLKATALASSRSDTALHALTTECLNIVRYGNPEGDVESDGPA